jgi:hypothetical protein
LGFALLLDQVVAPRLLDAPLLRRLVRVRVRVKREG